MSDFVIKYKAVKGYTGTNNEVVIPDGVKKISIFAFRECSNITAVTIPNSVTK